MEPEILAAIIAGSATIAGAIIGLIAVLIQLYKKNKDKVGTSKQERNKKQNNVMNNLPPLSSTGKLLGEGRKKKLNEIIRTLESNRLVILSAIGGMGKTTLARNIAEHYLSNQSSKFEAVVWISAKPPKIIDYNELLNEIAIALGYNEKLSQIDNMDVKLSEIRRILTSTKILFIFDNYETIADRQVDKFIESVIPDNNRIIVTTRHIDRQLANDQIIYDIVKLNLEDGLVVIKKEFEKKFLKFDNNLAIRIYNVANGLPQAIVWAVGQLNHISIDDIENAVKRGEARLNDGEELFEKLFALSWNILSEIHKNVLKAMLFFVNPVAKKALKASTDLTIPDFNGALNLLTGLSLISSNQSVKDETKFYSMHSWTRIFVERQLNYHQEIDEKIVAYNLAKYYIDFCADRTGQKRTLKGYTEIEYEFPNIKKVLSILNQDDINNIRKDFLIINLAQVINVFLWSRGLWNERIEVCKSAYLRAKNLANECDDVNRQALLYADAGQHSYYVGIVYNWQGKILEAENWAQKSSECMKHSGSQLDIALATRLFALIKTRQGLYDEALKDFKSVLQVLIDNEDTNQENTAIFADWDITGNEYYKVGRLAILQETGICYNVEGGNRQAEKQKESYNNAKEVLTESKVLAEEIGDSEGLSVSLSHLGHAYFGLGQYFKARKCYLQAYKLSSAIQRKSTMARACEGLAKIYAIKHNVRKFTYYGRIAIDLFDRLGMKNEYEGLKRIFVDKKILLKEIENNESNKKTV